MKTEEKKGGDLSHAGKKIGQFLADQMARCLAEIDHYKKRQKELGLAKMGGVHEPDSQKPWTGALPPSTSRSQERPLVFAASLVVPGKETWQQQVSFKSI